jgi:transposase
MRQVYKKCAGLDVHKKTVVACRVQIDEQGEWHQEVRTFGTMTCELLELVDWLLAGGVTHVALESTGEYWKPVYNLLEGCVEVLLVNAQHVKHVPGRKTDVKDAEWLAELLVHGLLKASFIPAKPQRDLRDLTRYRVTLVEERARVINRVQKVLENANIKLASVATDVLGVSGRRMLEALVEGTADAVTMAELAKGRLRNKIPLLQQALRGVVDEHHRFLLAQHLAHIDFLDEQIETVNEQIKKQMQEMPELPPLPPSTSVLKIASVGRTGSPTGIFIVIGVSRSCCLTRKAQPQSRRPRLLLLGKLRLTSWTRLPVWTKRRPPKSWPKSGSICASFPAPTTCRPGVAWLRAIARVGASVFTPVSPTATASCARLWSNALGLPSAPKTAISRLFTTVWLPVAARSGPL